MNQDNNTKKLIFSLTAYTSASILGPLIFFGGIGYLLDLYFQTKPFILIISVFIAFIFTNIFLYKKIKFLTNIINKNKKG